MPLRERSNNRILPANSRAVDVATQAILEITPTAQARMMNAFYPQGIQCILYHIFRAGRKCTCQSSEKQLNSRLDQNGKADPGTINQLLTGNSFNIDPYGVAEQVRKGYQVSSPQAPVNKNQGVFDIGSTEPFPFADIVDEPTFADNGPIDPLIDIDSLVGDFDASVLGFSDVACPICFGTGFIGGYAPFMGHRHVFGVADLTLEDGALHIEDRPWTAECSRFQVRMTLPSGAIGIDVFRVMNGIQAVPAQFSIDGVTVVGLNDVLNKCDGRPHLVEAYLFGTRAFTHLETQFNVTTESIYFEFPKTTRGGDTALLEQMEPFQIILSPNVPRVEPMDIIAESMLGKTLIVQNSNDWNSRNRSTLGWEIQVRVVQPTELYRILPFRGRPLNKNRTANLIRDNVTGPRRT